MVYYQPFISLPGRGIVGFEALVRWRHAERGLLEPSEFIPVAEESGLITRIDTWVLEEAIRQTAIWDSIVPGDKPFSVSANASARQLGRAQLPELVTGLLEQYGLPPQRIALEITETTLISAASTAGDVLNALSGIGIGLALDDFGMGFSSLSYLGKFPLDVIRIDRTFIEQLTSGDPTGYAIAEAIVQIGNVLKMTVVAEGVSDEAQLRTVLDLGCRVLQGYLISEPVPADRASDLLEQSLAHTTIQSGVDT